MVVVLSYDGQSGSFFPRDTLGRFPRLKIGWVPGRAARKFPGDSHWLSNRLRAHVKGLITVAPWWCRKTNSGRMMLWWAQVAARMRALKIAIPYRLALACATCE